jgi:hypothetical protein
VRFSLEATKDSRVLMLMNRTLFIFGNISTFDRPKTVRFQTQRTGGSSPSLKDVDRLAFIKIWLKFFNSHY